MKKRNFESLNDFKPSVDEYEREINRRNRAAVRRHLYKNFVFSVIVVAAAAVLVTMLWLPVMKVNGTSMEPILNDGDIIIAVKDIRLIERGDVVAFYYNDKVLLKRVIGLPGDTVNIDKEGNVYVNGEYLDEPYIKQKSLGLCDVEMPVTVQVNSLFVLGDNRSVSVDSRSLDVGNIYYERIVGKIVLRVFPFKEFGSVTN